MKLELHFNNESEIDQLIDAKMNSFLIEQRERFKIYNSLINEFYNFSETTYKYFTKKTAMLFIEDYLKAKIVFEYYKSRNFELLLLSDEIDGGWCVLVKGMEIT